ncbi:MAG: CAP domain-containing protein [Alphaproteobacteria bacterium]|nr:CAP domain-containing protein [Alphaproteobacteria bacterium]
MPRSSARASSLALLPCLLLPVAACGLTEDEGCQANSALEVSTHDLINAHRVDMGLEPLTLDACASEIARPHSQDMADGTLQLSHEGFDVEGGRSDQLLDLFPDAYITGENVAMNQGYSDPDVVAVQGWLDSPPHRENIELAEFTLSGMAIVEASDGSFWFTHLFVAE